MKTTVMNNQELPSDGSQSKHRTSLKILFLLTLAVMVSGCGEVQDSNVGSEPNSGDTAPSDGAVAGDQSFSYEVGETEAAEADSRSQALESQKSTAAQPDDSETAFESADRQESAADGGLLPPDSDTEGAAVASSEGDEVAETAGGMGMAVPTEGFFGSGSGSGFGGSGTGTGTGEARTQRRSELHSRLGKLDERLVEAKKNSNTRHFVTLAPGEELWVIAKGDSASATDSEDVPGSGCLMATLPNQTKQVPVPLKHTSVVGDIDGYIASVNVTQQFHNPYDSKIEASYVFPLPQNAAVNEFIMTVGDRKIRGIIREKEKAKEIYEAARARGHVASLMTQQRPNIFTQKVANIEPGKQIDIDIRYFNTLSYDNGAYEFVFPMVVGPRFNPSPGDGIGAVPRGAHGTSGQSTEVQYLAPNERSGHDVAVKVNINAGIEIEGVHCVNHAIETVERSECSTTVTLASGDTIPNKDFVLRYQVASDQIKTALLTAEDDNGKYFTMMVYPPKTLETVQRSPMEMVFVLDCSGSMRGKPIAQAKAAVRYALESLTERDTFQIIRFSNNASQLGPAPVLATEENVKRGIAYLNSLNGTGGTQMIEGMKAALDFPHDEGRFRLVSFMTDGYIGNEQQILTTLHQKLGSSRIFSFGVGSSPNRFLMDRMASLGRGAVAYLSLEDDAVKVVNRFNDQISHPAMTDLSIDWGNMNVTDVYPSRLPDLIVGRPVILTGRFEGEPSVVKVNGRVDMQPASFEVAVDEQNASQKYDGIATVWARLKIKDLMLQKAQVPDAAEEIDNAVTQTALAYNLMSSFTSFVAVDSMSKTEGEFGTTVAVPVSVPDGVRYDTTVGSEGSER